MFLSLLSSHFQRTPNNYLDIVKENCRDKWQSTKNVYLYLMGGIFPEKHQRWLANDILIELDSINWPIIYKQLLLHRRNAVTIFPAQIKSLSHSIQLTVILIWFDRK